MIPIQDQLRAFVQYLNDHFDELTQPEMYILLHHFTRHEMLKDGVSITEDDWDHISFGMLLKKALTATSEDEGDTDVEGDNE